MTKPTPAPSAEKNLNVVSSRLDADTYCALARYAAGRGINKSAAVRELLAETLGTR